LDLKSTEVVAKPALVGLEGDRVRFADGSAAEADVIVYCTGYKVSFPFFDPDFLSARGNDLPLWLRLVRPGEADLLFVGLLQPLGATMPLAEAQAKLTRLISLAITRSRLPASCRPSWSGKGTPTRTATSGRRATRCRWTSIAIFTRWPASCVPAGAGPKR
jgi:hypothetical protein